MAKLTFNIEDSIDFDSFMDKTNEEPKMIDIGSLDVAGSPYLSYSSFNKKILDPDITQKDMDVLLGSSLPYVLNNMVTGLNPKFKYLIENEKFLNTLKDFAERNLIDFSIMPSLNKIAYDYICYSKKEDIIIRLLEISLLINIKEAKALETVGLDKSTIALSLLAKNSETDLGISVTKFNNVLIANADVKVCTPKNLCDIYLSLFRIMDIFTPMMYDIKTTFKTDNMKTIYDNTSLGLLMALEQCSPSDIYKTLYDYSLSNPYGVKQVKFSLHEAPLGPNTTQIIRMLGSQGIFVR